MTTQMVSRFRVKKLSNKHLLPVYKESQLPDLVDVANIQRAAPQIETGVEKEEEEEHDLQAAISAAQAAVTTGAKVERYIPTPDASRVIPLDSYHALYRKKFKEPSTLIRFSSTVEDVIGCPYVMDEEDEAFLKLHNTDKDSKFELEEFEAIMWQFESITNQQLPHLNLDPSQIPSYADFFTMVPANSYLSTVSKNLEPVYIHWTGRRRKRGGQCILPTLKYEDLLKGEIDPYVCFRRRETKPVRKTRRTDQQSLERLRKLRTEMEMARNLLEMVLRREKFRKEDLVLEHTVFDRKCKLREYQRILGIKEDEDLLPLPKKKRKSLEPSSSGTTIKIPLSRLKRDGAELHPEKSPIEQAVEASLERKREKDEPFEDTTECPYQPFPLPLPCQYFQPLPSLNTSLLYRKRIGRNGRVFMDRIQNQQSEAFNAYEYSLSRQFMFDTDVNDDENKPYVVDTMEESYLKHRTQLLSETELRNLVTIPFLTPLNMSVHAMNMRAAQRQANGNMITGDGNNSNSINNSNNNPSNGAGLAQPNRSVTATAVPMKRQTSSRSRLTPQQQAVAMANNMIAANMVAAVNGTNPHRTAVQMAVAAAAQQQQHQQQQQQQHGEFQRIGTR
ncbi:Enhancer of polycomb-like protein 1 [Apophysomyces ossiformis]|uniref:Enhancer of polycomb-like protein n=1 Tax=Apophysomyces ossiformis TaxID=679940 RepID=A0A8H7BXY6_9FUNG|nr:Enhancer of polycomb-like protein 1 [Apophysomyces ossiformis]